MLELALTLTGLQMAWSLLCLCRYDFAKQPGEKQRIRWPGSFAALSVLLETAMAGLAMLAAYGKSGGVALLFSLFQLLATALLTESCLHCICLTKRGFVIRTHFGRVHECLWEETQYCAGNPSGAGGTVYLQTKQGRFFMTFLPPLIALINIARKQQGLGELPVRKVCLDPFDGHVADWPGLIAVYAMILAVLLGAIGFLTYDAFTPITAENTTAAIMTFDRWEWEKDGDLSLYANGMRYLVSYSTGVIEPVLQTCGTGRRYEVYTRLATPKDGADYHRIFAMTDLTDGTVC